MSNYSVTTFFWDGIATTYDEGCFKIESDDSCQMVTLKRVGDIGIRSLTLIAGLVVACVTPIFLAIDIMYQILSRNRRESHQEMAPSFMAPPRNATQAQNEAILVDFYLGEKANSVGVTIDQIWRYSDADIESHHNFIQWLFPSDHPSSVYPTASTANPQIREAFATNGELRARLKRSFDMMLSFYGLKWDENSKTVLKASDFSFKKRNWAIHGGHNLLRIDRIIRSLAILGLKEEAKAFYKRLETNFLEGQGEIEHSLKNYWKQTILSFFPDLTIRV